MFPSEMRFFFNCFFNQICYHFYFEVVSSLTIANGERFDFLINTEEGKEAKSYQMTFAGAEGSWTDFSGLPTLAFIQ